MTGNGSDTVLVVATNRENCRLISKLFSRARFVSLKIVTPEEVPHAIRSDLPAIGIVDMSRAEPLLWGVCDHLKQAGIAYILLSPTADPRFQVEAYRRGALNVLPKPLKKQQLLDIVRTSLSLKNRS